jgi:imidazole glycerol-phosphate synthase subunit HisH
MIVVIDYGMGNVGSILNMLKRIGAKALLTSKPADVAEADKLILPGVGAFDHGMKNLEALGLISTLDERVRRQGTPILGICLGMQLFTLRSEEGVREGLGWFDSETVRFKMDGGPEQLRVPHMGWNTAQTVTPSPLFEQSASDSRFYFVHSYHVTCRDPKDVLARTRYGYDFVSAVQKGRMVGVQFHPEKSHKFGMQILKNFVERF